MVQTPDLPPSERYPGRPPEGRIVVIAPTRASCETIEMAVGLSDVRTLLDREHGNEIRSLARSGRGFGIVAGTGTGKTLAIRPIAEEIVGTPLRVGVVNREREATPETPTQNVVIVTTGIARRWLQDDLITSDDALIVDEIHQTSAELELCLALGKRAGCRFIWLSATVDPSFYARYLDASEVLESSAYDPELAATVRISTTTRARNFLNERFLRHVVREKRGVGVFVPTRKETEEVAEGIAERWAKIHATFYHGGEPIAKLRPFLEGPAPLPYLLAMTAAGQSALNVQGLDTVVIRDAHFTTVVERGRRVLTRLPLGANEILQMAGRVHGRVPNGEVWILSERDLNFAALRPEAPNFQLAGDPERVALTCADVGVRADELDLPVPLDRIAYRRAVRRLEERELIRDNRLTAYGRRVEILPVDRPWGELLVHADEAVLPVVATCAAVESLYRMTRDDRNLRGRVVAGSDHLTAYNLYAEALEVCGSLGTVWGLPRHIFDDEALEAWADERGVQLRAIEDGALALASIYRGLDLSLPTTLPKLDKERIHAWRRLLARVMPFDLIIDQETAWGESVQVSRDSLCREWGAVAGDLRYFAGRDGRVRGSIEGTDLPHELVWEMARAGVESMVYDAGRADNPLRRRRALEFHGFELEADETPVDVFPAGLEEEAGEALAAAMAAGAATHPDSRRNRKVLRELRELYRRAGGRISAISEAGLTEHFLTRLADVSSLDEFRNTDLRLETDALVPPEDRARWEALPDTIAIGGRDYPLDYAFENGHAVARARVPAEVLPQIGTRSLPELDRPLHWTVLRGKKKAIRAETLAEAKAAVEEAESKRQRKGPRRKGQHGKRRKGRRR